MEKENSASEFGMIAKTFQGLEELLAGELTGLGANNVEIGRRMVSFSGTKELLYRANFSLRTALRILKPLCTFTAQNADEVYDYVKAMEWGEWLTPEKTFAVDSVVYSNEFRHSKFVAYRVKDAIADHFRETTGKRPSVRLNSPDVLLHIHIAETQCTLSLDSSGESLHRRGYRQEATEAPLNEVLAAGMVMLSGWKGECDLIDPMCGSGTILIEAGLIARNIAPGVFRTGYAFEKWPDFDPDLFERIYNDDSAERPFEHHLYGYDILQQANQIASRNVKAAGLAKDITLGVRPMEEFVRPEEKALMITNPPYGERLGGGQSLLDLYSTIGSKLKHEFYDNEAWIISSNRDAITQIGLHPSERIPLFNGALECEFRKYELFSGKNSDYKQRQNEARPAMDAEENDMRTASGEIEMPHIPESREYSSYDRPKRFEGGKRDDFRRSPRPFGNKPRFSDDDRRGFGDRKPRTFGNTPRTFGDRPARFNDRPARFGEDRKPFDGDRKRNFEDRPYRPFGSGKRFEDDKRPFSPRGEQRPYGASRPFDDRRRNFEARRKIENELGASSSESSKSMHEEE